jgi:hypothetical protein
MKIVKNPKGKAFIDVAVGEVFGYADNIYLKISPSLSGANNAFNITEKRACLFDKTDTLMTLFNNAELHLND